MKLEHDFFPLIAGELGASRVSSQKLQFHLNEFLPQYKVLHLLLLDDMGHLMAEQRETVLLWQTGVSSCI